VAESIDWASALSELNTLDLDPRTINDTLGVLLKYQDDIAKVKGAEAARLVSLARAETAPATPFG
jgi:hypothetical protein